jgi:hypothetical protein
MKGNLTRTHHTAHVTQHAVLFLRPRHRIVVSFEAPRGRLRGYQHRFGHSGQNPPIVLEEPKIRAAAVQTRISSERSTLGAHACAVLPSIQVLMHHTRFIPTAGSATTAQACPQRTQQMLQKVKQTIRQTTAPNLNKCFNRSAQPRATG